MNGYAQVQNTFCVGLAMVLADLACFFFLCISSFMMITSGISNSFEKFFLQHAYREVARECPRISLMDIANAAVKSFKPHEVEKQPKLVGEAVSTAIPLKDYSPFCAFLRHNLHKSEKEVLMQWQGMSHQKKKRYVRLSKIFQRNLMNALKNRTEPRKATSVNTSKLLE